MEVSAESNRKGKRESRVMVSLQWFSEFEHSYGGDNQEEEVFIEEVKPSSMMFETKRTSSVGELESELSQSN